ncbi:MAG: HD-GYP domain-containing protein [Clostridiaceae bacterium]
MLEFYDSIEYCLDICEEMDNNCFELWKKFKYDCFRIISFSNDSLFAISNSKYQVRNNEIKSNENDLKLLLKGTNKYIINLVLEERKTIIYIKDEEKLEYLPLDKEVQMEIYIPIFSRNGSEKSIIAVMYMGISNYVKLNPSEMLKSSLVEDIFCNIKKIYYIDYYKNISADAFLNFVNMLFQIAKIKDPYMVEQPFRTAEFSVKVGKELGFSPEKTRNLYIAAMLHDIGMILVSDEILKKDRVDFKEYEIIKNHSIYGYNLVKDSLGFYPSINEISSYIKHHHERFDGVGYPDGLKGEEIPLESRIILVSDTIVAMNSERKYRKKKNMKEIVNELRNNKGKQFDGKIVDIAIKLLLKAKNEVDDVFLNPIVWGTLSISLDNKAYSIEGTAAIYKEGLIFKTDKFNFNKSVDKSKIVKMSLIIPSNNEVLIFDVKSNYFEDNILYISDFKLIPTSDSFGISWNIKGIVKVNTLLNYNVDIYKIGGN